MTVGHYHPAFGLVALERGWVPSPSYLLRRHRVLKLLGSMQPGRLLEIGCGAGALLHDLYSRGFTCEACETSPEALELVRYFHSQDSRVAIHERPRSDWQSHFDVVMALEVLEHISDDRGALLQWRDWLRNGGRLILSVPAHQSHWNASDQWAGHFRRYERQGLTNLLREVGMAIEHFESYGFPLANLIEPVRAIHHQRQLQRRSRPTSEASSKAEGTALSGVERTLEARLWPLQASPFGVGVMRFFCELQGLFSTTDLGNGYLVLARRQ